MVVDRLFLQMRDHGRSSISLMHASFFFFFFSFFPLYFSHIKALISWHPCLNNDPSVSPSSGQLCNFRMFRMLIA